jgi:hypothetical protein
MGNNLRLGLFALALFAAPHLRAQHGATQPATQTAPAPYSTASVTVTWDPNDPAEKVTDYDVYWGTGTGPLTNSVSSGGQIVKTLTGLPNNADIRMSVAARNAQGAGPKCEEIVWRSPPYVPGEPLPPSIQGLTVSDSNGVRTVNLDLVGGEEGKKYTLELSEDLNKWVSSSSVVIGEPGEVIRFPIQWPLSSAPKKMFFRFRYNK